MFGRKCSLCGGKLDSRGVCTECGLDSNKTEKYYTPNQSDCDEMPLTHVHEEDIAPTPIEDIAPTHMEDIAPTRMREEEQTYSAAPNMQTVKPSGTGVKKVASIIIIAVFIFLVVGVGIQLVQNLGGYLGATFTEVFRDEEDWDFDYDTDPYEYAEEELVATGESADLDLVAGQYVVGVHIPEGIYKATTDDDFDVVQVDDWDNGIYLYEYKGSGGDNYLDDLRLYKGAVVTITTATSVQLHADATNPVEGGMANPITEGFSMAANTSLTVGEDIQPGIFDVTESTGNGYVNVEIYIDGEEWTHAGFALDDSDGHTFRYVVLPEGAKITTEDVSIELQPSETIESTDYESFYQ